MPFRRLPAAILQLLLAFNLLAILGNVTGLTVLVAEASRTPIVATLLNGVGVPPQGEPSAASGRRVTSMGVESSQAGESMPAGQPGRRNGMDLQAARPRVGEQLQALHASAAGVTLTTTSAGQADALNQLEGLALVQRTPHYAMRGGSGSQASLAPRLDAAAVEGVYPARTAEAPPNFS